MENNPEFVSYKKVLIFGNGGSGKSSLVKSFQKINSSNEQNPEQGKIKII